MYAKISNVIDSKNLREYLHISIDREFREDCKIWLQFLDGNISTLVQRPYVDLDSRVTSEDLNFYTDASGSLDKGGFGCRFDRSWIVGKFNRSFLELKPSIEYLELVALTIGVLAWGHRLANKRVSIFCDNLSVCRMVNSTSSGCKKCMRLIRILTLDTLKWNSRVFTKHVKSQDNKVADALSRGQWVRFRKLAWRNNLNLYSDDIPEKLWPIEKIWNLDP